MRGALHHLDLTARDPWASRDFYDAMLGFMGYERRHDVPRGFVWELGPEGAPTVSVAVMVAEGDGRGRRHDRYSPGLHHAAWRAESRADVDAMHARLQEIGAEVLDPPADYPQYGQGYYAVFFADPDGLKLEYVFTP